LGDRLARLQGAVDALDTIPDLEVVAVSPVYETDPVGGPEQPEYLNAVVAIETDASPRRLLEIAHQLEAAADRVRGTRWGPRTLDVDVLLVGDVRIDDDDLVIPHPRMWERAFVMVPLGDLDPRFVADLPDRAGVRRTEIELALPETQ
jgi:2-amino-4-hydroxy-6-hydroxymethyldihydropteridine diphosphokinase